MDAERYARAKELLLQALERPRDERAAFLDRLCGADAGLRQEVDSLLAYEEPPSHLDAARPAPLSAPASAEDPRALEDTSEPHPERIGNYRILHELGAGGMGRVFAAEQETPKRQVAVKVMLGALATPAMRRRFELEAELLGRLQHPGIARIYDAGTTEGAQPTPYLVMELVEGRELDAWRRAEQPDVPRCLRVLAALCDAVDHAHRRGVIHRDLKPSNVLIDDRDAPRVLDFGIARSLDDDARTLLTGAGQIMGTLAYMSPEQCSGDAQAIETRSDIYSLGVLGYQLLSGQLPHRLDGLSLPEALRVLRERSATSITSVRRELRGDLATVIHTAMAIEPARRYPSASAFASDLRNVLEGTPVTARPASSLYQLRRFVARNRLLVGAAALAFVALAAGTTIALWKARAERQARLAAEESRQGLDLVNAFMIDMLQAASPYDLGGDATLRQLLDRSRERAGERFADRPDLLLDVREMLSSTYASISAQRPARAEAEAAVALLRDMPERSAADEARLDDLLLSLASRLQDEDLHQEALRPLDDLRARRAARRGERPAAPLDLRAAAVRATSEFRLGDQQTALDRLHEALNEALRLAPRDDELIRSLQSDLGNLALELDDYERGLEMLRASLDGLPETTDERELFVRATRLGTLAIASYRLRKFAQAAAYMDENVATLREIIGGDHEALAVALSNQGSLRRTVDDLEGAEQCYVEALEMSRRVEERPSRTVAINLGNLAALYMFTDRAERAFPMFEEAREELTAIHGPKSAEVAGILGNLADCHAKLGRRERALEIYEDCIAGWEASRGPLHLETVHAEWRRLDHEAQAGHVDRAAARTEDLLRRTAQADDLHRRRLLHRILTTAEHLVEPAPQLAVTLCLATAAQSESTFPDAEDRADLLLGVGRCLRDAGDGSEARHVLTAARELDSPDRVDHAAILALLQELGSPDPSHQEDR